MREDKAHWPRCLLWHGWLPMLSGTNGSSPWAADASEAAGYMVETACGRYSSDLLCGWGPSDGYDEVEVASSLPDHPNVWTDGGLVLDQVTGVSASGAGFFSHSPEDCWRGNRWGHIDRVRLEGLVHSCNLFNELRCGVSILPLLSSSAVYLGVDNLGIVRHVRRLLDGCPGSTPFELVNDGDLLLIVCCIFVVGKQFGFLRLRVMLMRIWF